MDGAKGVAGSNGWRAGLHANRFFVRVASQNLLGPQMNLNECRSIALIGSITGYCLEATRMMRSINALTVAGS